ncbi:hypothetical protein HK099_002555, partial [Clydaea vesicula]
MLQLSTITQGNFKNSSSEMINKNPKQNSVDNVYQKQQKTLKFLQTLKSGDYEDAKNLLQLFERQKLKKFSEKKNNFAIKIQEKEKSISSSKNNKEELNLIMFELLDLLSELEFDESIL